MPVLADEHEVKAARAKFHADRRARIGVCVDDHHHVADREILGPLRQPLHLLDEIRVHLAVREDDEWPRLPQEFVKRMLARLDDG